jgi:DNA-binding transcriptional regulator GbsR (MarR family)
VKEEEIANILRFVQKDRRVLGETWSRVIKVDKRKEEKTSNENNDDDEDDTTPEQMKNNSIVCD